MKKIWINLGLWVTFIATIISFVKPAENIILRLFLIIVNSLGVILFINLLIEENE